MISMRNGAVLWSAACAVALALPAYGQIVENPIKYDSITALLVAVLKGLTLILIPFLALAIVYIGFQMVMAGAVNPEKFNKLKYNFILALVGLFLVLAANGVLAVVQNTIGGLIGSPSEDV